MSTLDTPRADMRRVTEASTITRARRRRWREELTACRMDLATLIEYREPSLDGVQLRRLVGWMPGVGQVRVNRILTGLPHHYALGQLNEYQRRKLLHRLHAYQTLHG